MRFLVCFLVLASVAPAASTDVVNRASTLYQHTEYESSLRILSQESAPDAPTYLLAGKNYFMLGDYKKAVDSFEKALNENPRSSEAALWLGRSWGRRAENGGGPMAMIYANRTRQFFEKAIALDSHNREAKNDLFDFYLNAPGFLGGGIDKAEAAARSIAAERPAEYELEEAQISEKKGDFTAAEAHFRKAIELAPGDAGRLVDLARFLAKRGRLAESDRVLAQAKALAPGKPGIALAEARTDIENHRNLEQARKLLEGYIQSSLTPDDPPRQEAEKLLKRVGAGG